MAKVPSVIDFKFAEEESELPDSNIDVEELAPEEEDILEKKEPELIKFEEKEKIVHDEIFDVKKEKKEDIPINPSMNGMGEDNIIENIIEAEPPKKVKKKRKPLSEEHKAKLAVSRAKALEVRRAKAAERKKMKELEKEEKELLKQQKVKKVQKLKEEVSEDTPKEEKRVGVVVPDNGFVTKKDLEQAQLDAIMKYDALRKARKEEKKKAALIEAEKNKMLNTINRAVGGQQYKYRDGSNIWDRCY
jgi:hypothetical protein